MDRLTPAYAGKTPHCAGAENDGRAHPRVCGEDSRISSTLEASCGSPPRMRGRRFLGPAGGVSSRLTPAYAGKTCIRRLGPG